MLVRPKSGTMFALRRLGRVPTEHRRLAATLPWVARFVLLLLIVLALVGLVQPTLRPTEIAVRPDQVSHALVIYCATLLAALSFPRMKPLWLALVFGCIATGAELAQLHAVVPGSASLADLTADAVGILVALVPIAVVRGRRIARAAAD